jgi:hypothetical protein
MKYNCDVCKYESYDFGNFSRHKQSKKHLKNESQNVTNATLTQQTRNVQISINEKCGNNSAFSCDFCQKTFTHHQSMYRHMKYHCKNKGNITENEKLMSEIVNEKNLLKEQNKKLLDLATTNANVAKKSISAMSFALKHYDDAPPIKLLEDEQFDKMSQLLMYDSKGKRKTERSIEDVILYHHKQNTLHGILGDLIVKIYKKSDPKKQSAWSSDVARLTFIVKDIIGKSKKSKWIVDKKGVHFTETVIKPLLEKISDMLIEYNNECGDKVRKMSKRTVLDYEEENEIKKMLAAMQEINITLLTIKLRKIHGEILKYVAPFFNLTVGNIDESDKEPIDSATSSLSESDSD